MLCHAGILKHHGNFLINNMEIECINTKLLARSSMAVKVNSPMFWVQLKTSKDFQDLFEELIRRMTPKGHMLRHRSDHAVVEEVIIRENRE